MKYRYFLSLALMAFFAFSPVNAQKRTLEEVKKSIGDLSADLKAYKNAQAKLKPALTNEATQDLAETWWLAARVEFGIYDKNRVNKSVGNSFDVKEMGNALVSGYDYCHCRHHEEPTGESPYGIRHCGSHHLTQGNLLALLLTVVYRHSKHAEGGDEHRDEHEGKDKRHRVALRLKFAAETIINIVAVNVQWHAFNFFCHLTVSPPYGREGNIFIATCLNEHGEVRVIV